MTEATFTLSYGIGPSDRPSIVLRADTAAEVEALMPDAKKVYDAFCLRFKPQVLLKPAIAEEPKIVPPDAVEDNLIATCPIHNAVMKGKQWEDGGISYSHMIPNVGWCNGKKIKPLTPRSY